MKPSKVCAAGVSRSFASSTTGRLAAATAWPWRFSFSLGCRKVIPLASSGNSRLQHFLGRFEDQVARRVRSGRGRAPAGCATRRSPRSERPRSRSRRRSSGKSARPARRLHPSVSALRPAVPGSGMSAGKLESGRRGQPAHGLLREVPGADAPIAGPLVDGALSW